MGNCSNCGESEVERCYSCGTNFSELTEQTIICFSGEHFCNKVCASDWADSDMEKATVE